ncbi:MAG: hypothetical protein K0Q50_355 [Vampirovibrio sp.]|jgi:hypothetical protein|nr:hypothetical protein [Vampirovibrio sp.]
MDSVVNFAESRKAKTEKSEQFRDASKDLLLLLERQRQSIPVEYMTFLLAMAISDQALHYAEQAGSKAGGNQFIENLFNTAQLLFDAHFPGPVRAENPKSKPESPGGQVIQFSGEHINTPLE